MDNFESDDEQEANWSVNDIDWAQLSATDHPQPSTSFAVDVASKLTADTAPSSYKPQVPATQRPVDLSRDEIGRLGHAQTQLMSDVESEVARIKQLKSLSETRNVVIRELALIVRLKQALQTDSTLRADGDVLPVKCVFEVDFLSSGSYLLRVRLTNQFSLTLTGWGLLIKCAAVKLFSSSVDSKSNNCSTQYVILPNIPQGGCYTAQILVTDSYADLPILVECHLSKVFNDPPSPSKKTVVLRLSRTLLSHWDLVVPSNERLVLTTNRRPTVSFSPSACRNVGSTIQLNFSRALLQTLFGNDDHCLHLCQWAVPRCDRTHRDWFAATDDKASATSVELTLANCASVLLHVSVVKVTRDLFRLRIDLQNVADDQTDLIRRLKAELLTRISVLLQGTATCLKSTDAEMQALLDCVKKAHAMLVEDAGHIDDLPSCLVIS